MESTNNLLYCPQPDGFTGSVNDVVQFSFSAKNEGQLEHAMDNFIAICCDSHIKLIVLTFQCLCKMSSFLHITHIALLVSVGLIELL